jgi:hypothetical protein
MWLFTPYGMFSVIRNWERVNTMLVRTRDRAHLDALAAAFPVEFTGVEILVTPSRDYPYRCVLHRSAWIALAGKLAAGINYTNFKDEVEITAPHTGAGSRYIEVVHEVWQRLFDAYQNVRPAVKGKLR